MTRREARSKKADTRNVRCREGWNYGGKALTFEEKLSKLELVKSKKNVLDEKEVLDAFAGEELTPEKLDRIYDFLDKNMSTS